MWAFVSLVLAVVFFFGGFRLLIEGHRPVTQFFCEQAAGRQSQSG